MVTIIHRSRSIGYVCARVAANLPNKIKTLNTRNGFPSLIPGTVIRWDSLAPIVGSKHTINSAVSVALSRNKRASRLAMGELCPETWIRLSDLRFPCLIRPKRHYAAQKFFVCNTPTQAKVAAKRCGLGWYASPFIEKAKEYRVFVFQDHIIKVVRRYPGEPGQLAWNIAAGGRSTRIKRESWPIDVVKKTILAGRALKLDWFAADVIVSSCGQVYVLELNTSPGLDREATLKNFAELFVWADEHPVPSACTMGSNWKSLIHPSLKNED